MTYLDLESRVQDVPKSINRANKVAPLHILLLHIVF